MASEPLAGRKMAERQAFVERLARSLSRTDDVTVVSFKPQALLVQVNGVKLMIGVQECD